MHDGFSRFNVATTRKNVHVLPGFEIHGYTPEVQHAACTAKAVVPCNRQVEDSSMPTAASNGGSKLQILWPGHVYSETPRYLSA